MCVICVKTLVSCPVRIGNGKSKSRFMGVHMPSMVGGVYSNGVVASRREPYELCKYHNSNGLSSPGLARQGNL
jgi:hypothetical protein